MNYIELSKEISYALRHAPWKYELEMDDEGWVSLGQLLQSIQCNKIWCDVTEENIVDMITKSEKKRHEISEGRIRANYGHSVPMKISKEEKKPPETLFHGTARKAIKQIQKEGLKPCLRQYVHLSQDVKTAVEVGTRRDSEPVVLVINAFEAYDSGVKFYWGNEKVWLSDNIPERFIKICSTDNLP